MQVIDMSFPVTEALALDIHFKRHVFDMQHVQIISFYVQRQRYGEKNGQSWQVTGHPFFFILFSQTLIPHTKLLHVYCMQNTCKNTSDSLGTYLPKLHVFYMSTVWHVCWHVKISSYTRVHLKRVTVHLAF